VVSLSQTIKGLHWDQIPNDNNDEVAARGILYLLIFQQLGQLVRWSWGYHVLLAPEDKHNEDIYVHAIEDGQAHYTDNPEPTDPDEPLLRTRSSEDALVSTSPSTTVGTGDGEIESGSETPITAQTYSYAKLSALNGSPGKDEDRPPATLGSPSDGPSLPHQSSTEQILPLPHVHVQREPLIIKGFKGWMHSCKRAVHQYHNRVVSVLKAKAKETFKSLPSCVQKSLSSLSSWTSWFVRGLWAFMNPPLWAMMIAIIVASVPSLQRLFFDDGTFVRNSVTRAIDQNGQVAVPLILVVLGANLARSTLPKDGADDLEDPKEERKLIIASLISRMLLPSLAMAPILAILAKYAPVSIMDDPIFIVVCFLLAGAPSALQLAQICQINNVYMGAMPKLLFQSYVVW
jgi:auxin efflux carrier family protein